MYGMYNDIPCNSTTMLDFFQYPGSNDMTIAIKRYRTLFGAFQSKNIVFECVGKFSIPIIT